MALWLKFGKMYIQEQKMLPKSFWGRCQQPEVGKCRTNMLPMPLKRLERIPQILKTLSNWNISQSEPLGLFSELHGILDYNHKMSKNNLYLKKLKSSVSDCLFVSELVYYHLLLSGRLQNYLLLSVRLQNYILLIGRLQEYLFTLQKSF